MVSYKGSISNYSIAKRLLIWTLVIVLPLSAISLSLALFMLVDWWGFVLIFDMMVILLSLSLSGLVLKGHRIHISDGEIRFTKGWSKGRIPYRNMIKTYRVGMDGKDAILLVYSEPSTKTNPNRCLTIEQTFTKKDRDGIFMKLLKDHEHYSFPIVDMASLNQIRRDKVSIGWVPV